MKPKLILIGGISRCGKSSLAENLVDELPKAVHLDQDNFMLPEEMLPTIKNRIDWERPECLDWVKLLAEIDRLSKSHEYIIIEGIFAFNNQSLNEKAAYKINLLFDKDSFITSRSYEARWGKEPKWYIEHVWQSHLKYHNPFLTATHLDTVYSRDLAKQLAQTLR